MGAIGALRSLGLIAAGLAVAGPGLAAPFTNGNFEAGVLSPWSIIYPTGNDAVGHTPSSVIDISSSGIDVHAGGYGVGIRNPGWVSPSTGGVIGVLGMISQDLDTVAGHTYRLSYWMKILDTTGTDLGTVGWGDATAGCDWAAIIPSNSSGATCGVVNGSWVLNTQDANWIHYDFTVTAPGNLSTVVLAGRSDFSRVSFDDVTVTPSAAVPEPATLLLLGTGLAAIGARRRGRVDGRD